MDFVTTEDNPTNLLSSRDHVKFVNLTLRALMLNCYTSRYLNWVLRLPEFHDLPGDFPRYFQISQSTTIFVFATVTIYKMHNSVLN